MVKVSRLPKKIVEDVIKRGRLNNFPLFGIKYLKNSENLIGFAIVVSKKEAKLAVTRNMIRRKMAEIFRKYFKTLGLKGYFVIFAKKDILNHSFESLNIEVEKALLTFDK